MLLFRQMYFWVQALYLRALAGFGFRVQQDGTEKATVVILSYKRASNIQRMLTSVVLCGFVDRIIVSNNNPDVDITGYITHRDPRLEIIQSEEHRSASYRYDVARTCNSEYFICIDDDVFPDPWQLRKMFTYLLRNPESPVGSSGEIYDHRRGEFSQIASRSLFSGDLTCPVDVILHIYVFTRKHLECYFEIVSAIGETNEAVHSSEDVIISFTGDDRPTFLDVGNMPTCSTCDDPDIATYQRPGFTSYRLQLHQKLIFLGKRQSSSRRLCGHEVL